MFLIPYHFRNISRWIRLQTGSPRHYSVFTREYPDYRFVDLYRAVEAFCRPFASHASVKSINLEMMSLYLKGAASDKIQNPGTVSFDIGFDEKAYFPIGSYWSTGADAERKLGSRFVIGIRMNQGMVTVEIAARSEQLATQVAQQLENWSIENSVYRFKTLLLQEPNVPDYYGNVSQSLIDIQFVEEKKVSADNIILDSDIQDVIRRNVFLFHEHHKTLTGAGVSSRRSLLFHGPPGTGKTYTTQYIANQLRDRVTTFIATGQSLQRVETICQLARLLQPSLVVIEDMDLVFASREINLYSTALGDFMDQLDGFHSDDAVTFLMTTNALDRVEQALKDRPGRVNQCLYFGPPTAALRAEYLNMYLRREASHEVDLEEVVSFTEGVSQAYLKELYQRAVLSAFDRQNFVSEQPNLTTRDFVDAHHEMTHGASKSAAAIMGFGEAPERSRNGKQHRIPAAK